MKMKLNPNSGRNVTSQHKISNMVLIVTLLLVPFLHKPVSRQQGSVRIIFKKQHAGRQDASPLTINVSMKDELTPVGYVTLLVLLFAYTRKREEDVAKSDDTSFPGIVMGDDEVLAAWGEVKRMLLQDEKG